MDYLRPPSAPPLSNHSSLTNQALYSSSNFPSLAVAPGQAPAPDKCSSLYIREYPHRAVAIVSPTHALILRHNHTTGEAIANGLLPSVYGNPKAGHGNGFESHLPSKCMVEFSSLSRRTLAGFRPLTSRPIYGTLGLIAVDGDVFVCAVTQASRAATIRPGETVERIVSVSFFCLSSAEYDDVVSLDPLDQDTTEYIGPYGQNLSRRDVPLEHPCAPLRKLLSNGSFYYSTDFDVTNRLQDRQVNVASFDMDNMDEAYLWNSFMIKPLVEFRSHLQPGEREALDSSNILTSTFRGFCRTIPIPHISAPLKVSKNGLPSFLTVISRLSCRRAGTRFLSRGIDDDGNVANFVETETIYWSPSGLIFSYAQVRGSVPIFWEQPATELIPGRQRITVTRSPDGTQPAFNQHFENLTLRYGAVHAINLLSETKPGEAELSQLYRHGVQHCPLNRPGDRNHALLKETHYDFHAETKGPAGYEAASEIRRFLEDSADGFAYFLAEETDDATEDPRYSASGHTRIVVVLQQEGIFRTNCLDCLDRTNLIQTLISRMAAEAFLGHRGHSASMDFWMRHSTLWADNGDALSKIYAGTGALKSSFTRHGKSSLSGALADMRKSVQRLYHNNFVDPSKQVTIDMLLGRLVGQAPVYLYDPISDFVSVELNKRSAEFSSKKDIQIFVGTFNLNGRTEGFDDDLAVWLCPEVLGNSQPEIVVIGFQEIVELSAQHIVNTDPTRKHMWEQVVKRTLNERAARIGGEKYVLLRSGQLVGAALCIFVTVSALRDIKNVEGSVKKTGLSGMAGNKGAVAIRMDYVNSQICFVTAHLAAGFANYDERNRDYATISSGLRFQRNRGIGDHDTVIWLGDFNYRIGLSHDVTTALVKKGDLASLYENDQLNLQMVAGLAFPFYSEARITFPPTYKFDIGTDAYDTSDKARIPAWTDRILRKGSSLRQLSYNSAPLRVSDHRPVYATFTCSVSIVNEALRASISDELYRRRKADVGDSTANEGNGGNGNSNGNSSGIDYETEDEDLIGYDALEPGLPAPSSDRKKWWLENGKAARVDIAAPKGRDDLPMKLNPRRPSNPFAQTDEPDWVSISRSPSRLSTSSMSSSPYEHVSMSTLLSSSASSTVQRRPLPPFDPSLPAKVGRMNINDEQSTPPPPPPPRRQTANAMAVSQVNREQQQQQQKFLQQNQAQSNPAPAPLPPLRPSSAVTQVIGQDPSKAKQSPPPVAKKPAHLSNSPSTTPPSTTFLNEFSTPHRVPQQNTLPTRTFSGTGFIPTPPRPTSRASSPSDLGAEDKRKQPVAPPKPPQLTAISADNSRDSFSNVQAGTRSALDFTLRQQQLKALKKPVKMSPRESKGDLLGALADEEGIELGSWGALQPTTR